MTRVLGLILFLIIILLTAFIVDICYFSSYNAYSITMDYINITPQQRATFNTLVLMPHPYVKIIFAMLVGAIFLAILIVLGTALRSKPEEESSWY